MERFNFASKRLVVSYIFDWFVIFAIAAVGGGWNSIHPYHRPFSVTDLSISYPYQDEIIKTWILVLVALIAPGIIIVFVSLFFVPGPTATRQASKALVWKRKLWEWNAGWMGLGLSLATAFMFTQGMKLLFGKPRPDLLSRCQPDLNALAAHAVGSYARGFSPEWILVDSGICQQTDRGMLDDGFKSFPSGHASFSWAGLLYLSLFLSSKFAIAIPFLPSRLYSPESAALENEQRQVLPLYQQQELGPLSKASGAEDGSAANRSVMSIRNQAAAPPTWTLVLAIIPIAAAIYICSTRYAQFYHFGADIIGGSVIGIIAAWFSFRWYHLPIRTGAGWAWGARSRDRAFGIGVGMLNYVGPEGWGPAEKRTAVSDAENVQEHGDRSR
ncbi:acid phosphatase/Vanadium-dependent haloperoxidase [Rhizodiscina lignyota]|uniref:Acid phosphatase/Vanadium-dependent haloperoxidase n=1 Tax=Rhizodiscina lignyota TaxID=1504668 RepID=A0A9P4I9G4_9PEZI|nr:acid phosphatase/Vanadium-dependent haloperoxidase [Rhizodiscina lignyota]